LDASEQILFVLIFVLFHCHSQETNDAKNIIQEPLCRKFSEDSLDDGKLRKSKRRKNARKMKSFNEEELRTSQAKKRKVCLRLWFLAGPQWIIWVSPEGMPRCYL